MISLLIIGATICGAIYLANRPKRDGAGGDENLQRQVTALHGEIDTVRRELSELAERVDFAERMLAKQRDSDRLAPPRS